ncbi:hypothetical protein ACVDG8_031590 [Mesorhizobium sp. ORM8.1]
MIRPIDCVKVIMSNPSDMNPYREKISEVISDYNRIFGYENDIHFEVVHWGQNVVGQVSDDGQLAVNDQMLADYDLLIAVVGGRLGSETPRARSGTEEEVNHAIQKKDSIFQNRHVQVLFKKHVSIDTSNFDPLQLDKVKKFRADIQSKALTIDFDEIKELEDKVRRFLESARASVKRWKLNTVESHSHSPIPNEDSLKQNNVEATYNESGVLDETEETTKGLESLRGLTSAYSEILKQLTPEINSAVERNTDPSDVSNTKAMFDEIGNILEAYTQRLSPIVDGIFNTQKSVLDHFDNVLILSDTVSDDEKAILRSSISGILLVMKEFGSALDLSYSNLQKLPPLTTKFNVGRRKFLKIGEILSNAVKLMINSFSEYEEYLQS